LSSRRGGWSYHPKVEDAGVGGEEKGDGRNARRKGRTGASIFLYYLIFLLRFVWLQTLTSRFLRFVIFYVLLLYPKEGNFTTDFA
jgi:hypothetical protein